MSLQPGTLHSAEMRGHQQIRQAQGICNRDNPEPESWAGPQPCLGSDHDVQQNFAAGAPGQNGPELWGFGSNPGAGLVDMGSSQP